MNFQEYKEHRKEIYSRFADFVKEILCASLKKEGHNFQQIQARGKEPDSLEKKLKKNNMLNSSSIEEVFYDFAGCRIIFYGNDDFNKFVNSGIISDNFIVNWDRSRIHYPGKSSDSANARYTADHYVIKLKQETATAEKGADFTEIWCEIQVQTVKPPSTPQLSNRVIWN